MNHSASSFSARGPSGRPGRFTSRMKSGPSDFVCKFKAARRDRMNQNESFQQGTDWKRMLRCPEPARLDYLPHWGLGLAVVAAICISASATIRFCAQLDRIEAALNQAPAAAQATVPANREPSPAINA